MTTHPSTSKGEPPSKKRRTDDFDDEADGALWDDEDFTAADLDDIADQEIRASQASTSKPNVSLRVSDERDTTDTFLKPRLSRSSSSFGSHSNSTSSRQSRTSSVLSVISNNSIPRQYSSDSSYPASLSGYSGTSSSSIRSGDESTVLRRPSYLTHGSGSDSDHTSPTAKEEIAKIKLECAALTQKVTRLNEELCAKDGENKLLRDNLNKKDEELGGLKSAKVTAISQLNKQQVEKEKKLQSDVTKLQTQLQFKEQDHRELSNRVKELESQISNLQAGPSTSQIAHHQSSPKPSKVLVRDISPVKTSTQGFPTKKTFMATEGSPKKKGKMSAETPTTSKAQTHSGTSRSEKKLRLNTKIWRRTRECQLVAKLLDVPPNVTEQTDCRSIIGLLNTPWVSSSLQNVQFDRDRDTSLLSPIKSRLSDVHMLLSQSGKEADMIRLVDPDHFNLAMKGLKDLLSVPETSLSQTGSGSSHMTLLDLDLSQEMDSPRSQSDQDQFQRISSSLGQSALDSAILLLPMLQDYLQHYIDMLETSFEISVSTSGASNASMSESPDSSSESPTGSLGILLRSTTTYANNLESLAIAALRTLCTLVTYSCVRKVLFYMEENNHSPGSEAGIPTSSVYTYLPLKFILKLRILPKVIRLTAVQAKGKLSNKEVVETSLSILEILARRHAQGSDAICLLPLLSDDVLQRCVENEVESSFTLHGLLLFKALCRSKLVVSSLCSNATGCVLLSIYSVGLGRKGCIEGCGKHTVSIIKTVIESIYQIACCHKGGMLILMDSDCQCSGEVVKCIVLLLYKLMEVFEQSRMVHQTSQPSTVKITENQCENFQSTCLDILENGLLLLHLMSQHDPEFANRHGPVQRSYVLLICGMSQMVKNLPPEKSESLLTAIHDLWDFNQDDSELSLDSDTDMNETTENDESIPL